MRRAAAIGVMGLTMIVLSAAPAWAQWEWFKWIQELSGPGPFVVNGPTITFGCTKDLKTAPSDVGDVPPPPIYRAIQCDRIPSKWTAVKTFLSLTVAHGDGHNNLDYPPGREKLERVSAWMFRFAGTFRGNKFIDAGAGAGMLRLSGTPDVFVTKGFLEPFLSVRPFGGLGGDDKLKDFIARSVDVTAALTIFPQGFRLSDFGATGGAEQLDGDPEFLPRFSLRLVFIF